MLGLRMDVVPARGSQKNMRRYASMINDRIDKDPSSYVAGSLFRIDRETLLRDNATVFIRSKPDVGDTACLHTMLGKDEAIHLNGLLRADAGDRADPRTCVAWAIALAASAGHTRFIAQCRVFPNGYVDASGRPLKLNRGSYTLFNEFAFVEAGMVTSPIHGDDRDRHLLHGQEPGGGFRSITLTSTASTVRAATTFLAEGES